MRNAKFCPFVKNTKHFRSKHFFCIFFKDKQLSLQVNLYWGWQEGLLWFCGWPTCNILFDQGICIFLGLVQSPVLVIPACEIWSNIFWAAVHLISEETKWAFTCVLYFFYFIACTSFPWMFFKWRQENIEYKKKREKKLWWCSCIVMIWKW